MSLEEEISLYQFGQGVHSLEAELSQFSQLDKDQQERRFFDLYCQFFESKLIDSDVEQAMAECMVDDTDTLYAYLRLDRLKTGPKVGRHIPDASNPPDGRLENAYSVLLCLFKAEYQRRYAVEKENPAKWWYWNLASEEIVQGLVARHQALVEEVYNTPGFRSEFVSLAKLWYDSVNGEQAKSQEPAPDRQTHFDFLTYNEMVTESVKWHTNNNWRSMWLLRTALEKALSIRYHVDADEAGKITFDVIERHLRETYNTELFYKRV